MTSFCGDTTIVRSTHGIEAVRRVTCVSNDIAVHALEVDAVADLIAKAANGVPLADRHGGVAASMAPG